MTEQEANRVYDLLVELCGAVPDWREPFVKYHTANRSDSTEWRFAGFLGFGGKFWSNDGRWWVTCYSEDENEARRLIIDATNQRLAELKTRLRAE